MFYISDRVTGIFIKTSLFSQVLGLNSFYLTLKITTMSSHISNISIKTWLFLGSKNIYKSDCFQESVDNSTSNRGFFKGVLGPPLPTVIQLDRVKNRAMWMGQGIQMKYQIQVGAGCVLVNMNANTVGGYGQGWGIWHVFQRGWSVQVCKWGLLYLSPTMHYHGAVHHKENFVLYRLAGQLSVQLKGTYLARYILLTTNANYQLVVAENNIFCSQLN